MENIIWKTKSFEKNKHESQIESFKILEIEKFLKQALKRKNFGLHDYRLNISNTKINILISNYEKKDTNTRNILTIEKQKNYHGKTKISSVAAEQLHFSLARVQISSSSFDKAAAA